MNRLGLVAAILTVSAVAAGHAAELKVAVLAPLSGPLAPFGMSTRNGALLAVDQANARGGVLGLRVRAIVEDSQCAALPAEEAAKKVIHLDRVRFVIGEVCSKASLPVSDIANAARVIQISPASTNPAVTVDAHGSTKAYVFRACFIDPFQGTIGATFAFRDLKARRAFILVDPNDAYGSGLAASFEAAFVRLGGKIAGKGTYGKDQTDFAAVLSTVRRARPDIVYLPDYFRIVNLVTRQARGMGIHAPFLGGDGWDSTELDARTVAEGYFTDHFSPFDPRSEVRDFLVAYGSAFQTDAGLPRGPDGLAALAYDATGMLLEAIREAGSADTDRVRSALERISYPGVSGTITFDRQHNPQKPAVILAVRAGRVDYYTTIQP